MTGDNVGVAVSISAPDVTIADVTIRDVGYHAIQVRGELGASRFTLAQRSSGRHWPAVAEGQLRQQRPVRRPGTGGVQRLQLHDERAQRLYERRGHHRRPRLADSGQPLHAHPWTRGPPLALRPTILAWGGSSDTIVERNLIVDSFRGIALGLAPGVAKPARNIGAGIEHQGGLVRNNAIVNLNSWADEGIEINAARDARVEQNTVLVEGTLAWVDQPALWRRRQRGVMNNLTNREIRFRDNGLGVLQGNAIGAARDWFVDAPRGDMRMTASGKTKSRQRRCRGLAPSPGR
jgi:hypothetical protein